LTRFYIIFIFYFMVCFYYQCGIYIYLLQTSEHTRITMICTIDKTFVYTMYNGITQKSVFKLFYDNYNYHKIIKFPKYGNPIFLYISLSTTHIMSLFFHYHPSWSYIVIFREAKGKVITTNGNKMRKKRKLLSYWIL